jgi:hypothetical protein
MRLSRKSEADELKKIDVNDLNKQKYFNGFKSGIITWTHSWTKEKNLIGISVSAFGDSDDHIKLKYVQTDENGNKKKFNYKVKLLTTPCNFGGKRYWFQCPVVNAGRVCQRRVGVLYKLGDYFACRHCNNLTYRSRNEGWKNKYHPTFRIFELYDKIEQLEAEIKRYYYNDKPTKKYKKLLKLESKLLGDYALHKENRVI